MQPQIAFYIYFIIRNHNTGIFSRALDMGTKVLFIYIFKKIYT